MSLNSIKDQPLAVELCRAWLKRKTTHPLLFYGPVGAGKKRLALELAMALNCASVKEDACGECLPCRKIQNSTHADVRVIDLAWQAAERKETVEKQQSLRIETVMTERHRLLQSPLEGTWKVSILSEAHKMTPDASNVLLKILEEPPAHTAIILISSFRDRLLATLISRCQPVRFRQSSQEPTLSHEEVEAHRDAELLWDKLASGSPARLVRAAEGRSRTFKTGRPEIEKQIQHLLIPAARALRSGDLEAQEPVRLLQRALSQLRHNVQPGLVYDNVLLQLSSARQNKKHL